MLGALVAKNKSGKKTHLGSKELIDEYNDLNFLPYKLNNSLLTQREAVTYSYLVAAAQKHNLVVCVKPRIADFVSVTLDRYVKGSQFHRYFNRISAKHVDFLLCRGFDLKPVLAIELDDSSHSKIDRMERDEFVNLVYHVIDLNVIHLVGYITQEQIEAEIDNAIKGQLLTASSEKHNIVT